MKKPIELLSEIVGQYDDLKYALLEAQTFDPDHYGFQPICYEMMDTDTARVDVFRKAFEQYDLKDKVICEAGVGRLALTKLFLPKVKKAYLIENNPHLFALIQSEVKRLGYEDKVTLIFGDAMQVTLPEPVDFIVGELMSIYCANEYQVQVFKHLRQFLKPGGKLLPEKIINVIQLADASFDRGHKHYPILMSRHMPVLHSLQAVVNTTDLYTADELTVLKTIECTPILSGVINAVYIRSFVEVAKGCNFSGTDSLMPPTVVRLEQAIEVHAGEPVNLSVQYTYGTDLDEAVFRINNK